MHRIRVIPPLEELTIEGFRQTFRKIIEVKERSGIRAILDNPPDLFDRAKMYGTQYSNGAWGWRWRQTSDIDRPRAQW